MRQGNASPLLCVMELPASPRIAILGAGALGGYLGARLAHAEHDVHFLLRSDYEVVREKGWQIDLPGQDSIHVHPVQAYQTPEAIGPVDLVIIGLKSTQNAALEKLLPPLLKDETTLCTIQNGMGNAEALMAAYPNQNVLTCMCHLGAAKEAPGHLCNHSVKGGMVRLGQQSLNPTRVPEQLAAMWNAAGVRAEAVDDIEQAIWQKLMWNVPFNGLPVLLGGTPTGRILADPELTTTTRGLMEELRTAASARGRPIAPEVTEQLIDFTRKMGSYQASTVVDLKAGRPLEIEPIWGEPLRRGQAAGAEMPRLQLLYGALRSINEERMQAG